jgi:hypothetical protein
MTQWFQRARRDKNRNLVRFKTEKPSRLQGVETGRKYLPNQKFSLLRKCVLNHSFMGIKYTKRPERNLIAKFEFSPVSA